MKNRQKRGLIAALALALTVGAVTAYSTADAADMQVSEDKIKVFIGSPTIWSPLTYLKYQWAQRQALEAFAAEAPDGTSSALVTFDDYLTEEEMAAALGGDVTLETVYLWAPGCTGRMIIDVNSISISPTQAVAQYFDRLDLGNWLADDPVNLAAYRHVEANYGYFAAKVTARNQALVSLDSRDHIAGVELIYSEYAEARAAKANVTVSYICVPSKPDGAL